MEHLLTMLASEQKRELERERGARTGLGCGGCWATLTSRDAGHPDFVLPARSLAPDLLTCSREVLDATRERIEQERAEAADWMMRIAEVRHPPRTLALPRA